MGGSELGVNVKTNNHATLFRHKSKQSSLADSVAVWPPTLRDKVFINLICYYRSSCSFRSAHFVTSAAENFDRLETCFVFRSSIDGVSNIALTVS